MVRQSPFQVSKLWTESDFSYVASYVHAVKQMVGQPKYNSYNISIDMEKHLTGSSCVWGDLHGCIICSCPTIWRESSHAALPQSIMAQWDAHSVHAGSLNFIWECLLFSPGAYPEFLKGFSKRGFECSIRIVWSLDDCSIRVLRSS